MSPLKGALRLIAVAGGLALATDARAQQPFPFQQYQYPQNSVPPGIASNPALYRQWVASQAASNAAFNHAARLNPALYPWMNQPVFGPVGPNPIIGCYGMPATNSPFAVNQPVVTFTPPLAVQLPGQLMWGGPDFQVNPVGGLVYRPLSGVAQTRDGTVFYRLPGTGLATPFGTYAPGTGVYYNPNRGTYLNPASGVISRPRGTNVFIPWIP